MRAKGDDRVKEFRGGVKSQREKLNVLTNDHNDLVDDVEALERKINAGPWGEEKRLIVVDLGEEGDFVGFRYFDALGTDRGPVE